MREPAGDSATHVVTFPTEVDISNAPYAATWLLEALEAHPQVVIADMSLTEFCDSSGIRILLQVSKRMTELGAELRIVLPSPGVRRAMHFAGVENVLRLYPDMAAAQAGEASSPLPDNAAPGSRAEAEQAVAAVIPQQRRTN